MAKPTGAVKGFVRLTQANSIEIFINISSISTVRSVGDNTFINLTNGPSARGPQELIVYEPYEEVIQRISDAS